MLFLLKNRNWVFGGCVIFLFTFSFPGNVFLACGNERRDNRDVPLRVILVKALSAEKDVLLATFEGLLSQFYAVFFFLFFY